VEDDMKPIGAAVMAAFIITVATPAGAQVPGPDAARGSELSVMSSAPIASARSGLQSTPMFTFGRGGVRVWTPVAPPYNAQANGDLAARDIWGAG
jgi:hypothetical protein